MKKIIIVSVVLCIIAVALGYHLFGPQPSLHDAAETGDLNKVKRLLRKGADVNAKEFNGYTPLMWAVAHTGHVEIVKVLLEKGADVSVRGKSKNETPLGIASHFGGLEIVRLLLDKGADITAKDNDGSTPLMLATRRNHKAVVALLRERGAKE